MASIEPASKQPITSKASNAFSLRFDLTATKFPAYDVKLVK